VISVVDGSFRPIPFEQMMDPATGKTRVRMVNILSDRYRIARRYMLRLRRDDFSSPETLARFADICKLSVEEFRKQFEYLVRAEPPALEWSAAAQRPAS